MTKALLLLTIPVIVLCLESVPPHVRLVQQTRVEPSNEQYRRIKTARASIDQDGKTIITATVVAYDLGVEQGDGSCRQTAIGRRERSAKRNESERYFIIRHQSSCLQLIPEQSLKVDRQRSFKLKRDTKCDQTLEELQYFITLSPTGSITKSPRLKTVRGWEEIQVAAAKKLPCYILTSSEAFER